MLKVGSSHRSFVNLLVVGTMIFSQGRVLGFVEAATEDLLLNRPGGGDAGRMWPGFAAGEVAYDKAPSIPNPIEMVPSSAIPAITGGDLSFSSASIPSFNPAGLGMGGLGALAGNSMMQGLTGMGSIPGLGGMTGSNLSSLLGLVGATSLLKMLPNIQQSLSSQQILDNLEDIAALSTLLTDYPEYLNQGLNDLFPGLVGLGTDVVQSSAQSNQPNQATLPSSPISGAQGGVAGNTPYKPQQPGGPPGPSNNNRVGEFDTAKAWNTVHNDNAGTYECGKGVANILEEQGHTVTRGHGHTWNESLEARGWQKVPISDPSQAPIGSVLVYEHSGINNGKGAQYGHVEIASVSPSGQRTYISGTSSSRPGGSVRQNWDGYAWLPPGS